ncbi:MAG: tail fiber protein [Spirochaetales bacterium]|nr:tail fiber protein [Spirochaetales bacterium]
MNNLRKNMILVLIILLCGAGALLAQDSELNTFEGGQVISASQMNANFQLLLDKITKLETAAVPVGSITAYGGSIDSIPEGWLLCDGKDYPASQYPALANAIKSHFGSGGAGSFNVPDLRGVFLRGVDMALDGTRTGRDEEREVGSYQEDAFQAHQHGVNSTRDGHADCDGDCGDETIGNADNCDYNGHTFKSTLPNGRTASETRPKNVAVYYIIKAE